MEQTHPTDLQVAKQQDTLWHHVLLLLKNPWYCASQLLVAFFSFGFYITHYSVGVDALSGEYYVSGELIAQGRMTWTLLGRLFKLYEHWPFFDAAFGVCLMLVLVTLICAFFRMVTKGRLSIAACIVFGCLFISYPLSAEAYHYQSLIFYANGGGLMAFGALYALYRAKTRKQHICAFLLASFLLMAVCSLYESILICYVFLVFAFMLLRIRYDHTEMKFTRFLIEGLSYALPMIVGVIVEALLSDALIGWLGLTPSVNGMNNIIWADGYMWICLSNIITGFINNVFFQSLIYLPMAVIVGAMLAMFIYGVVDIIRHKPKIQLFFCYIGLFFTLIMLSVIRGAMAISRTLQVFPYFVAFVGLLLMQVAYETKNKSVYRLLAFALAFLVYHQANDLSHWFALNNQRFEQDRIVITQLGHELEAGFDIESKPVIFTGYYEEHPNIKNANTVTDPNMHTTLDQLRSLIGLEPKTDYYIAPNSIANALDWCIRAFDSNRELFKYFDYYGYRLIAGTKEMWQDAQERCVELPAWPKEGSIVDVGEYILVHFEGQ